MTDSGFVYKCSAGETFDKIALEIYGYEKYASELMCANPEYGFLRVFTGGEILKLPVIEVTDDALEGDMPDVAPWKQ